jgi:multidrug efflux pump subunit AcrA (membrane-fusion protein)
MSAQAELVVASKSGALVVPEGAVLTRDGASVLFVVVDNRAEQREVQTGIRANGKLEIVSGLQAGEAVVIVGQDLLTDGDLVSVSNR